MQSKFITKNLMKKMRITMIKLVILLLISKSSLSIRGITVDSEIKLIERSCYADLTNVATQIVDFELKVSTSSVNDVQTFQLFKQNEVQDSWLSGVESENGLTLTDQGTVIWIEKLDTSKAGFLLKINASQNFDIFTNILAPQRRIYKIPLKVLSQEEDWEYKVTGSNFYYFDDPISNTNLLGNIMAVTPSLKNKSKLSNSSEEQIFTKLVFYGSFRTYGGVSGYLIDDLEMEDFSTNEFFYLGNVSTFPVYVKCKSNECDLYYVEVLAGRLYVGYLYTLINSSEVKTTPEWKEFIRIDDFCPQKVQSSFEAQSMIFHSKCSG